MDNYVSPFTITSVMLEYVSKIMEKIGKMSNYTNLNKMPNLRKQSFVDFKNMILGKKVKFKAIYFIYFFLSAGIMTYIIGTQVFNAYNIFTTNLKMSNSFMQSLWAIKFYIIIILLFVVSKIKRFISIG